MKFGSTYMALALCCCVATTRPATANTRGSQLSAADQKAEKILQNAPDLRFCGDLGGLRLLKTGKAKPPKPVWIPVAVRKAIPILAKAKAALDHALKRREKVDGAAAATFLARYPWFRAAYVYGGSYLGKRAYSFKRFHTLVDEGLTLDPRNPQALLMRAWLSYLSHSKVVMIPWPGGKPLGGHGELLASAQGKIRIEQRLRKVLRVDPNNFQVWYIRWLLVNNGTNKPTPVKTWVKIWTGLLRTATHADLFYFAYDKAAVFGEHGIVGTARRSLAWYPKYYEQFYGRPPPPASAK